MHGAGNDYVYVDTFREKLPMAPEELAPLVSNRHFGIGSDGLVLICPSDVADAQMRMFNPDGSESEMCGNAVRCVAKYVAERSLSHPSQLRIATGKGVLTLQCEYEGDLVTRVRVDMGAPILEPALVPTTLRSSTSETAPVVDRPVRDLGLDFSQELGSGSKELESFLNSPLTCVSMGNPHCVIFVDQPLSEDEVRMRVWERGTGETLACGTGACAVGVSCVLSGRTKSNVLIHLLGGDLQIEWNGADSVYMTGPALETFSGILTREFFKQSRKNFTV